MLHDCGQERKWRHFLVASFSVVSHECAHVLEAALGSHCELLRVRENCTRGARSYYVTTRRATQSLVRALRFVPRGCAIAMMTSMMSLMMVVTSRGPRDEARRWPTATPAPSRAVSSDELAQGPVERAGRLAAHLAMWATLMVGLRMRRVARVSQQDTSGD